MRNSFFFSLLGIAALSSGVLTHFAAEQIIVPRFAQTAQISNSQLPNFSITQLQPHTPDPKPYTLVFVGDLMLSRTVEKEMREHYDFAYPFRLIANELASADLAFGNLEGPISTRGTNQGSKYSFRAKPEAIEGLTLAGFNVLSLANNHILDWGRMALEDTLSLLTINNIVPVGAGKNYEEANAPKIVQIGEGADTLRVAFLAYTNLYPEGFKAGEKSGISNFDLSIINEAIKAIRNRNEADIIVISLHWGEEYKPHPTPTQREIAHALVDAGADLIIGHHPHVIQDIEQYVSSVASAKEGRNGYIFYSLGNFVFDQYFSPDTMRGLMIRATIRDKKIDRIEEIPIQINDTFQPELSGT